MRFLPIFLFTTVLLLLLDIYLYKGIRLLLQPVASEWIKRSVKWSFWAATLGYIAYAIWVLANAKSLEQAKNSQHFFALFGWFIALFVPGLIWGFFHLLDDISFGLQWLWKRYATQENAVSGGIPLTRAAFLTRMGLIIAAVPFLGILYGITKGKYDFRIIRERIRSKKLPAALDGLTIVQISDAHLGSFSKDPAPIHRAIEMINKLNPDVLVFTGDLVNNYADEAEFWIEEFKQLKARYGKFSILGNHDYGDYVRFPSPEAKVANLDRLKAIHREMGFTLLLNRSEQVEIASGTYLQLAGVENWGLPPFPQHGDLAQAVKGIDQKVFSVLLSHDPSHWDAEVLPNTDIDLTLSGHTHGMQFGIEIAGFKWSPVKYKYPRWGGLYKQDDRFLYVNRGFGFLGFPGRVGMPPEITLLELRSA
ncbi:MAG TPA: metallophosphoesterase [Luteibaculaceae bacterium]|nr:metallophosphoesterase [Luteibaculaceae bacterium]